MFRCIDDMPPNVLAIEAVGEVTHEDYRDVLISKAEAIMAKSPIRMFYVIGKEFTGFELEALWDDGRFGLKHWHDFSHIAVVTDQSWLRTAVAVFTPIFPGEVRVYGLAELDTAKAWIKDPKRTAA
jgi:hypothetical protein